MDVISALAKEILILVFRAFPGQYVLVGGGALHWIFHSPRLSADIDLKPVHPGREENIRNIADFLAKKLPPVGVSLGLTVTCQTDPAAQAVRILVNGRPTLSVELALLSPGTGKEKHLLQSESLQSEIIVTPDIHQLLFAKAAALIKRPQVKGRDVFDIWFLQSRGANLDVPAFTDWLKWEEKEPSDVAAVLKRITPSRLRADLSRFLPDSIHKTLEKENYKPLIEAAGQLLHPFL